MVTLEMLEEFVVQLKAAVSRELDAIGAEQEDVEFERRDVLMHHLGIKESITLEHKADPSLTWNENHGNNAQLH